MTSARTEVDPAVLRVVLQRLCELEDEVQGVTDTVIDHLPYVDAGPAQGTVSDAGAGLVEAFATMAESLSETQRLASAARARHVEIDLRVVSHLDRAAR